MSLATRCASCGTVFRVVQDQLKISEGWVRCGQCQDVFNALESLFDLAPEPDLQATPGSTGAPIPTATPPVAPPPASVARMPVSAPVSAPARPAAPTPSPPTAAPAPRMARPPQAPPPPPPPEDRELRDTLPAAFDGLSARASPPPASSPPPPAKAPRRLDTRGEGDFAASHWAASRLPEGDSSWTGIRKRKGKSKTSRPSRTDADQRAPAETRPVLPEPTESGEHQSYAATQQIPLPVVPAFVRQADRAERWRSPRMVGAQWALAAVLAGGLLAQVMGQSRDLLAARAPAMAPVLATACQWVGCEVQAPRSLAHLVLDSSHLVQTARPGELRLSAELRNSAAHVVRTPALEVSFTDMQGQLVARKVLLPAALRPKDTGIAPETSWQVDVVLAVANLPITGFTVEAFYP